MVLGGRLRAATLVPLLLFLGVFTVYLSTAATERVNIDAWAASAGSWRIATTGTPWMDGIDVLELPGTHRGVDWGDVWIAESPNGHVTPQRMAGPIIAGVPFYLLFGGSGTQADDFSLLPAAIGASALSAVAVLLLYLAVRKRAGVPLALGAALVFALATPTWVISANGLWTHPITQLGIAGAAYAASRDRWWAAGLWLAVGMLGRPHIALIAAVIGLGMAVSRRDWRPAFRVALPTSSALVFLTAWNYVVHGVASVGGPYGRTTERAVGGYEGGSLGGDQLLNYLGFLFSLNRGLLVWTPLIILFVPAVIRARKHVPEWSIWLAVGGVLYTFFQLRLNHFSGGVFFYSYRHGLELLTAMAPLLVFSAPFLGQLARRAVPVVVAVQFAALTVGAANEGFFLGPDSVWSDNGFWFALRHNPAVLGPWLLLCTVIGIFVALRFVPTKVPQVLEHHDA